MDIADPSSLGFTLTVVDHALRPRNLGPMAEHSGHARITGPCADTAERGVQLVIAGGMGQLAQVLFAEQGIQVLVGAPADTPEHLVQAHLDGTLRLAGNACDH
jgi:predicted Fe-Mo cluster-binding NifX family protein